MARGYDVGWMVRRIHEITERISELERRREVLLNELTKLRPLKGTIEYKWVLNKIGKRYYYYYLRVYDNGKLRSIYLGPTIPEDIWQGKKDRAKARAIQAELRRINKELISLYRKLARIRNLLFE